ncbi:hypothetical protein KSS87_023211 [Heliosperma pusillum]|nr:hypothetical protein KSS87_023211 [Heliosperma pusillum]
MASVAAIRKAQRADGPATILAIGTATPPNYVYQADYPDYYFRVTKSEHMTDLKEKFRQICEKSMIKKRYSHLTEDILKKNPNLYENMVSSLDTRQDILVSEVPKLGKEAAVKAIKEWGQPKSKITHLIMCTCSGIDMPGADYQLTKLLSLNPSVRRYMIYNQGCFAGGTVLRLAKDLAENNKGSRVLVVCSEMFAICFNGPTETHMASMVGHAIFGDGAAALIIGSDPDMIIERPLFQIISAAQTLIPDSEISIGGRLREMGLTIELTKDIPILVSKNINKALEDAFSQIGITDYNTLFWAVHPGGRAILDQIEVKVGLKEEKLNASRHVLSEYGNMLVFCLFLMK